MQTACPDADTLYMQVVLVDDVPAVRELLRHLFADAGCRVVGEAADGESAVHIIRVLRPDVVVMDVEMPVLDGIAATRRIAGEPGAPRVIAFTGRLDREAEMLAAGASACFEKLDLHALVAHVAAMAAD
jgi:CheY-like chemotaxis protein